MRRMLDPTKVGGGEDKKLYCHFIEIDTKNGEQICFNYTSTDETKLTKETIFSALKDKKLICTGYIMVRDAAKRLQYIYVANDGFNDLLRVKWVDLTTLANSTEDIYTSRISFIDDKAFPVS